MTGYLIHARDVVVVKVVLLDRAVLYFQEAGDLSSINNAVYNLTQYRWLTLQTQTGRFLTGIFGWDPRPSFEQVAIYLAYAIPVGLLFYLGGRAPSRPASPSTPVRVNA